MLNIGSQGIFATDIVLFEYTVMQCMTKQMICLILVQLISKFQIQKQWKNVCVQLDLAKEDTSARPWAVKA